MSARVLAILLSALVTSCGALTKPSDSELIANFRAHRHEIDAIVAMIRSDKVLRRVDDSWTDPGDPTEVGICHERIAEYRTRLDGIGYQRGFYYRAETGEVKFLAWAIGIVGSGASKSFLYLNIPPAPIVEDLDTYKTAGPSGHILAYRHVEGNWYLEYSN